MGAEAFDEATRASPKNSDVAGTSLKNPVTAERVLARLREGGRVCGTCTDRHPDRCPLTIRTSPIADSDVGLSFVAARPNITIPEGSPHDDSLQHHSPAWTASDVADEELVASALAGSRMRSTRWSPATTPAIFDLAFHYMHNREEADDLAQVVFMRAYQHLRSFHRDRSFTRWILTIAAQCSTGRP